MNCYCLDCGRREERECTKHAATSRIEQPVLKGKLEYFKRKARICKCADFCGRVFECHLESKHLCLNYTLRNKNRLK